MMFASPTHHEENKHSRTTGLRASDRRPWKAVDANSFRALEEKVDALFARWNARTPGVVVALRKMERIVLLKAYGSADLRFGLKVSVDDRFNVGSIAKQFTANLDLNCENDPL